MLATHHNQTGNITCLLPNTRDTDYTSCFIPFFVQLWYAYLKERRLAVRGLSPEHPAQEGLTNTYERALVSMHKMPRVWLEYLEHLVGLGWVTRTRRAFDRSLMSLPITQHERIWTLYLVRRHAICGIVACAEVHFLTGPGALCK